jgi:hypothetical protein
MFLFALNCSKIRLLPVAVKVREGRLRMTSSDMNYCDFWPFHQDRAWGLADTLTIPNLPIGKSWKRRLYSGITPNRKSMSCCS